MDEGAEFKQASNDVDSVLKGALQALQEEEGCYMEGTVIINKVPGNFHISTHAFGEVVQRIYMQGKRLDFSHTVNHLSFGNDTQMKQIQRKFGEKFVFDLDGHKINQD
jgi:hypothetical protein